MLKALGGDNPLHLTPTRVLRSGRRVAATPQVPASARRKASRVPAEEQTEAIDLQPRRVPVTEQVTAPCTIRRSGCAHEVHQARL